MMAPHQTNDVLYGTGDLGFLCRSVYVMEKLNFNRAFSFLFYLDRRKDIPVIKYTGFSEELSVGVPFYLIENKYPDAVK